jgi:PleD family two-component response regulator
MQGKLVLVVDDDSNVRRLLTELLRSCGLRVATLPDGERVHAAVRKARPAAVVLDIGLPGKHGLTVLDELKADARTADVPVLVASAWCDSELVSRAIAAGAAGYLRKPFSNDAFLEQVRSAVRGFESGVHTLPAEVRRVMKEDRLTGLPNRLGTQEALAERLEREAEVGLVLVRVGGWEGVRAGGDASAADLLLRMLAGELRRRIRPGDALGRWSDDTFLVVAAGCDLTGAATLAVRLRGAAELLRGRADWTLSTGYASTAAGGPDALLERCERALGAASGGRLRAGTGAFAA